MSTNSQKYNPLLIVLGVLFTVWGILGMMDAKNYIYDGFSTDGNNTVTEVDANSPAEAAGIQVGDVIKSYGGIPIENNKELSKMERAKIGETRNYVMDRAGEEVSVDITYAPQLQKDKTLNIIGFLMGLVFIFIGLYANSRFKNALSFAFAVFAVFFGFNFFGGPYFGPGFLGQIISALGLTIILLSIAFLALYMFRYPPESKVLSSKNGMNWLFVPAVIVIVFFWVVILLQPDGTSFLNTAIRLLIGAFVILYFGTALVTLIRKYAGATPEQRKSTGLNLMLIGTILGLVPILLVIIIDTISPKTVIPGNDYIWLTFIFIPVFFLLAQMELQKNVAEGD